MNVATSRVIGLDIGTTRVRAAELEFGSGGPSRTAQPTVLRVGEVPLPPGAVKDGEVVELSTVSSALQQLWAQAKFSHKEVVLGVGNQRVIVRDLELPAMPLHEVRASLPYQVQDLLPVAVDDALLDFVPTGTSVGEHGALMQGLLVAATKETVLANTAAAEAAGLKPMMVDLTAFALGRVMARGELAQRTIAVVDVGARITTLAIVAQGVPRMVRLIPSGGQNVTDVVASTMGITGAEAENAKRQIGVGFTVPPEVQAAAQAVGEVATSLIEAIRNTFVYYAGSHPGASVEHIVLTGGGSQLPGLGQYLSSASRIPASMGQPLATLRLGRGAPVPAHLVEHQHELAIPLGLAFGVAS